MRHGAALAPMLLLLTSIARADSPAIENLTEYRPTDEDLTAILALSAELGITEPAVLVFEPCRGGCGAAPCTDVFVEVTGRAEVSGARRSEKVLTIGHVDEDCDYCTSGLTLVERDGWVTTAAALRTVEQTRFEGAGWRADIVLGEALDYETAEEVLRALHDGRYTSAGEDGGPSDAPYLRELIAGVFDPMDRWALAPGKCSPDHPSVPPTGLEGLDPGDCYRLYFTSRDGRSGNTIVLGRGDDGLWIVYGSIGWVRC